jgi:hypothetical protein
MAHKVFTRSPCPYIPHPEPCSKATGCCYRSQGTIGWLPMETRPFHPLHPVCGMLWHCHKLFMHPPVSVGFQRNHLLDLHFLTWQCVHPQLLISVTDHNCRLYAARPIQASFPINPWEAPFCTVSVGSLIIGFKNKYPNGALCLH